MKWFFELMFSGLFTFIGMCIVLGGLGNFIFVTVNRIMRHANIMKHGYPPPHCDADGDAVEENKEDTPK